MALPYQTQLNTISQATAEIFQLGGSFNDILRAVAQGIGQATNWHFDVDQLLSTRRVPPRIHENFEHLAARGIARNLGLTPIDRATDLTILNRLEIEQLIGRIFSSHLWSNNPQVELIDRMVNNPILFSPRPDDGTDLVTFRYQPISHVGAHFQVNLYQVKHAETASLTDVRIGMLKLAEFIKLLINQYSQEGIPIYFNLVLLITGDKLNTRFNYNILSPMVHNGPLVPQLDVMAGQDAIAFIFGPDRKIYDQIRRI